MYLSIMVLWYIIFFNNLKNSLELKKWAKGKCISGLSMFPTCNCCWRNALSWLIRRKRWLTCGGVLKHFIKAAGLRYYKFPSMSCSFQASCGEVPKRSQRRRLEIGWGSNSPTRVRIPPSPPIQSLITFQNQCIRPSAWATTFCPRCSLSYRPQAGG